MPTPLLRDTTPDDTDALLAMAEATAVFKPHEIDTLGLVLEEYFGGAADAGHLACTLELDGETAGFVYVAPVVMTDRTWELWWIIVHPQHHGQGWGRWLLQRAEGLIASAMGRVVFIETSSTPHYEPTRQFYLKSGYTEVARLPDYYCHGDDKVIYRRVVKSADPV
jgi:ribosomal protein S18 acetylase RimI-like enzyme